MGKVEDTSKISAKDRARAPARKSSVIEKRLETEVKRLQQLTKDTLPPERRRAVMPLLQNIAFYRVKLDEARRMLLYEDLWTDYDNGGGQSGIREHPGFIAYNKMFTTFSRSVNQLADMMPSGSVAADALIDFINETRLR